MNRQLSFWSYTVLKQVCSSKDTLVRLMKMYKIIQLRFWQFKIYYITLASENSLQNSNQSTTITISNTLIVLSALFSTLKFIILIYWTYPLAFLKGSNQKLLLRNVERRDLYHLSTLKSIINIIGYLVQWNLSKADML